MHAVIINCSPRAAKFSNTDKIIDSFGKGLTENGATYEKHALSARNTWDDIRAAYMANTEIIFALPLYVEAAPGIMLEFLETLEKKDKGTRVSFILQSGFAEGCQLRCGEEFLLSMPGYLGVSCGGCLCKGDNFGIRVLDEKQVAKILKPWEAMGALFAEGRGFEREEARKFTGPEYFSLPMRLFIGLMFKTMAKKMYTGIAEKWGCKTPLDAKPWEEV